MYNNMQQTKELLTKPLLDWQLPKICLKETGVIFFMGLPLASLKAILWSPEHTKAD
jgi:hypothetical protein